MTLKKFNASSRKKKCNIVTFALRSQQCGDQDEGKTKIFFVVCGGLGGGEKKSAEALALLSSPAQKMSKRGLQKRTSLR